MENGNAREFHTQLDESEPHLYVEYIINLNELQNGVGKYIAQTRSVDKEGHSELPYYPTRITVIDTDYSNYSVEYKCVKLLKDVSCVYFILSRKPYVLDPNVEPILNKLKLKLQDFTLLNKPGCEVA
uniref:Nitrophorin 4b n=1 Tax=Triatoma infestans TaxID=30076 RepID=A0A170ZCJ2_TRIIF